MKTTITRPVAKRCPYRDETDYGELTVGFDGPAPELHELGAVVDALADAPISHEDFTAKLAAISGGEVTTRWHTGPWSVEVTECCTTATPQDRRVT